MVNIIIPSIVIDEIKKQKRRVLRSQYDKFTSNYFTKHLGIESAHLQSHINEKIEELYLDANSELPHLVLELETKGKLEKIRELAINNKPPFEANSDKGFKDAYIYLTVLQYLESADDDVFVLTNDSRLKQAFDRHADIVVLSSPEEYINYREEYFKEEYFINRMIEFYDDDSITIDNILNIELTVENDWQILVFANNEKYQLLVDFVSKEIIENEVVK